MIQPIEMSLTNLEAEFGKDRVQKAIESVGNFQIEIPSWIFGEFGGGRFSGYMPPGFARSISEKLDDAALVNQLTGATEQVALHVLWDLSANGADGDYAQAKSVYETAREKGLRVGSISPTCFLDGTYRGSFAAEEASTRQRFVDQTLFAGQVAGEFGTHLITLWVPDGSIYPGQVQLRRAINNVHSSVRQAYEKLDPSVSLLIEYKLFEPGTYSTVISDWGSAYMLAKSLGPNAGVLVDMGHHAHGTNIEQIVARLIADGMWCGFHFNTRYAADDDHAVEPSGEMARIFYELVSGQAINQPDPAKNWAYMIDQCSGRENRIHAILHSVDSLQISLAKAMLVDSKILESYQAKDDIIRANRYFNNALLHADVRPIVQAARLSKNLPLDPVEAYVESGYQSKIESERK